MDLLSPLFVISDVLYQQVENIQKANTIQAHVVSKTHIDEGLASTQTYSIAHGAVYLLKHKTAQHFIQMIEWTSMYSTT